MLTYEQSGVNIDEGNRAVSLIKNKIKEAKIDEDVMGSDHCPVELEIEI